MTQEFTRPDGAEGGQKLTDEEVRVLKSLARPATSEALLGVSKMYRDYESYGRLAAFISSVAKWLLVIAGFLIAAKTGVLGFFGVNGGDQ